MGGILKRFSLYSCLMMQKYLGANKQQFIIKAWLLLAFVGTAVLHLFHVPPALACEQLPIPDNWWYRLSFQWDASALPPNLQIQTNYTFPDDGGLDFLNSGTETIYLVSRRSISDDEFYQIELDSSLDLTALKETAIKIEPFEELLYSHGERNLVGESEISNRYDPGGIPTELPPPLNTRLIFLTETDHYIVPLTIHYNIHPDYDPTITGLPSTVRGRSILASHVVEAVPVDPEGTTLEPLQVGYGYFAVRQWFKGSGPAIIKVSPFGSSAACYTPLPTSERPLILFLTQSEETGDFELLRNIMYLGQIAPVSEEIIATILETTGQEPVVIPAEAHDWLTPSPTPTDTPTNTPTAEPTVLPTHTSTPTQEPAPTSEPTAAVTSEPNIETAETAPTTDGPFPIWPALLLLPTIPVLVLFLRRR